jgi:type I restriction enzyme S subunit
MSSVSGWQRRRFDEFGELYSGSTPPTGKNAYWDGDIVWITPTDLSKPNSRFISSSNKKITTEGLNASSTNLLPAGNLVISSRAPIGYVAIPTVPFCTNQGCKSIRLKDNFDPDFAYYNVLFNIRKVKDLGEGTTFAEISKTALATVELEFPESKLEQTTISKILSTVDRALDETQALIAKQQRIKSGLMQDLLTRGIDEHGNLRSEQTHAFKDSPLGRIPTDWDACRLGSLIEIKHGFAFSGEFFSDQRNNSVLLTPGNFHVEGGLYFTTRNSKYYTSNIPPEFVLANGDVVVVMTDLTKEMAILGNPAIVDHPDNVLHNQRIGKVKVKADVELDSHFLTLVMSSSAYRKEIQRTATGTTVRHTSPTKLLSPYVPRIAPDEQLRIASRSLALCEDINQLRAELNKRRLIKAALMQALLTGKKRVTSLLKPEPTH